jgi:hypothetical protein
MRIYPRDIGGLVFAGILIIAPVVWAGAKVLEYLGWI